VAYRQSFAWWSFAGDSQDPALLAAAAEIGYEGVDFLVPSLWAEARRLGLRLAVIDGHEPIEIGFNDPAQHAALGDQVRRAIEAAQCEGAAFVAVTSGDRRPNSGGDALTICAHGLAPLANEAAEAGVVLLIEPLNTKVDHPGHECDTTEWAAQLVRMVGSPALRINYDYYHAQIMEGNLMATVDANRELIAHLHTAGVPGRHELDDSQEINWRAIADHLRTTGYDGYVAHELCPRGNPVAALRQAFEIFDGT